MTNGFRSWAETHHEIVANVTMAMERDEWPTAIKNAVETEGTGGIYDLCINLTNQFENEYEGVIWDGEWFDTLDQFLEKNLS